MATKKVEETVKKTKKAPVKKEMKTTIMVQHQGKEIDTKDFVAAIKKEWTKTKHKIGDIQTMELYIKPEDGAVYYVVNGEFSGKVEF